MTLLSGGTTGFQPSVEVLLIALVCIVLYGMTRILRRQDS